MTWGVGSVCCSFLFGLDHWILKACTYIFYLAVVPIYAAYMSVLGRQRAVGGIDWWR